MDDINSLSNRRVRPVGELRENQFKMGLSKVYRNAIEKISFVEKPSELITKLGFFVISLFNFFLCLVH